jgi:hypothetical protein
MHRLIIKRSILQLLLGHDLIVDFKFSIHYKFGQRYDYAGLPE